MKGDLLYGPAAIAAVICGLSGQAGAQALVTHRIPAALALEAVAAAVESCGKQGYAETAIVVDADGVTQALLRGDWTGVHSIDSATYKAYTSATMKVDTSVLIEREKTDPMGPGMAKLPRLLEAGGSVVIKVGDEVVGAIGAAGAPGSGLDENCAKAGLAKIQDRLK
ncbi:MAG TPA: heme-binding protein [Dongiaceae bacterium]|nr:heme-binding protein [Dongiaceae bacterium]